MTRSSSRPLPRAGSRPPKTMDGGATAPSATPVGAGPARPASGRCPVVVPCVSQTSTLYGEDIPLEGASAHLRPRQVKSYCTVFLLWFFLGIFGAHNFYLERPVAGAVYACSLGGLGVGWLVDGCRLRQLVAEANYGVSARAGVHYRASSCCGRVILTLAAVPVALSLFILHAPGVIRRFDPMGCGFESDPYRVLGISHGASAAEVRSAYRALSKKHHPDRNPGCGETCVEKMAAINQAKETIDNRGGGSFGDSNDLAEQWNEIYECFTGGTESSRQTSGTRAREPFYKSAGSASAEREDCSEVCPVGVCDSPDDAFKPECTECALCHQRGGRRRKKSRSNNKKKKTKKQKKQKAKKKKKSTRTKASVGAAANKRQRKSTREKSVKTKEVPNAESRRSKVESGGAFSINWEDLTAIQRGEEIRGTAISFWAMAVEQVMENTPAAQEFSIPVWMWTFFLKKCGIKRRQVGSLAIMFADSLDITLDAFLAYESEAQVRAMLLRVHHYISDEENEEAQLSTANEALLLKGYRIVQHLTAVLANVRLDRRTVLGYSSQFASLLGMDETDVIPLTDAAKDGMGVDNKRHRVKLDISSALIVAGTSDAERGVDQEMASLRSVLRDMNIGLDDL